MKKITKNTKIAKVPRKKKVVKKLKSENISEMPKHTNPLYVVTNKGIDVEEVQSSWQRIFKKWGPSAVMDFMQILMQQLAQNIRTYAEWLGLQKIFQQIFQWLEEIEESFFCGLNVIRQQLQFIRLSFSS